MSRWWRIRATMFTQLELQMLCKLVSCVVAYYRLASYRTFFIHLLLACGPDTSISKCFKQKACWYQTNNLLMWKKFSKVSLCQKTKIVSYFFNLLNEETVLVKFLLRVTELNGNQCSKCSYSWYYLSINILSYFHEYEEIVHTE